MSRGPRRRPLLVGALVLAALLGGASTAQGQASFSEPLVWERLMRAEGFSPRDQTTPFASGGARPGETVVTLDGAIAPGERDALLRHARAGGRVVAAGRTAESFADALGLDPRPLPFFGSARRVTATAETRSAGRLRFSQPATAWRLDDLPPTARVLYDAPLTTDRLAAALRVRVGRGVVVLVASSGFVGDRDLLVADNAAFAVRVLGPRGPVVFRTVAASGGGGGGDGNDGSGGGGDGSGGGGGAPPPPEPDEAPNWPWALLLGVLTGLVLLWSGRRLGPPTPSPVDADPARGVYAEAMGTALAETGDAHGAVAGAREAARRQVLGRVGAAEDADPAVVHAAAVRAGLPEDEAAAVADRPGHDPLAVGRALARLQQGLA